MNQPRRDDGPTQDDHAEEQNRRFSPKYWHEGPRKG